jgi:hypothetical protein
MKQRPSMEKRRKEQARRDRREEKAARRERRKGEREAMRAAGLDPDLEPLKETASEEPPGSTDAQSELKT